MLVALLFYVIVSFSTLNMPSRLYLKNSEKQKESYQIIM